jgi:16S rRNA processing protein RimM
MSAGEAAEPQLLADGRVVRPHGLRGELLINSLTDFPEHLSSVEVVYLGDSAEPHSVARVRTQRGKFIIQLGDCPDREAAEKFRGQLLQIKTEAAAPLPPGMYYHHQVLGLEAFTEDGERLGELVEVLETGANDVYVILGEQGEILLPVIPSVIRDIDLATRRLTVHLLDGLR